MRIVITVCDSAAAEECPYRPRAAQRRCIRAMPTRPTHRVATKASARPSAIACCSYWHCRSIC
ncbi:fragment of putative Arsenate reductase (arsC) (part 1) [Ralstonia solanacearum K60]|nr:fragment of putative Arsenate reductase (arsC) (part 1) [Ralstonia solanacearum K60]